MSLQKQIQELLKAGVISEDTAEKIELYYKTQDNESQKRTFVVFDVLGALLTGLGIILIIAHNWDNLSKVVKTFLAFIPLFIGQILFGYTLIKKMDNMIWRESTSTFLFFAVGASIALISQIYHLSSSINDFMLTWLLLVLPLVYLMRSSMTSLLYITGISYYVLVSGYNFYSRIEYNYYWILCFFILPFYYWLFKKKNKSNALIFHHWLIPLSVLLAFGTLVNHNGKFIFVGYMSLLGVFYLIGNSRYFKDQKLINNAYKIIGSLGTIGILLALSFKWFWDELRHQKLTELQFQSNEFIVSFILTILAAIMFFYQYKGRSFKEIKPLSPVFFLFSITFIIGLYSAIAVVFINLIILGTGILTIKEGEKQNNLVILNYGLIIISMLIISRFFDTNISFIARGLLFILVGGSFFITNYLMLKKRNNEA